jgi:hypothetical protein
LPAFHVWKWLELCSFELSISDWYTTEKRVEKVSNAWYLVPFLLAIVSGIAAYLDLKDRDPIKARECLVFGIIWTIFLVVFWGAITNWRF